MIKILLHKKKFEHAALWLFLWLFIFDYYYFENNWIQAIGYTSAEIATYAVMVYSNLLILIPTFLKRGFVLLYTLFVLLFIVAYILIIRLSGLENIFYEYSGWRNVFSMILNSSLFLVVSLLFWYFEQWQLEREKQLKLVNEKLHAELNFLRTQLNPHFIFNTLNNIYSLSLQKHENAAPMIANLSTILRHTLYEGAEGRVPLQNEVRVLQTLIDLYLMAKPKSSNVKCHIKGNCSDWQIMPMLLLNFTENCFKHSNINTDPAAYIKIECETLPNGEFIFVSENTCLPSGEKKKNGGIGLQNAIRSLELYYPQAHSLEINTGNCLYTMRLTLQLEKI